ncbi:MAG: hypothetical protein CAF45_004165 [Nitrospira sp. CG24E]|nr:MAG: hypothetical protein CAF45_004165 [Nitrospira sp. CG24E]
MATDQFKLLSAYAGVTSMKDALADERGKRLLWLEILVNDQLDLTPWLHDTAVQAAYQKACRWFTTYRSLITTLVVRTPLPPDPGPIDQRDYRTVMEALRFVSAHH